MIRFDFLRLLSQANKHHSIRLFVQSLLDN